jgi:hypothetical protein
VVLVASLIGVGVAAAIMPLALVVLTVKLMWRVAEPSGPGRTR